MIAAFHPREKYPVYDTQSSVPVDGMRMVHARWQVVQLRAATGRLAQGLAEA